MYQSRITAILAVKHETQTSPKFGSFFFATISYQLACGHLESLRTMHNETNCYQVGDAYGCRACSCDANDGECANLAWLQGYCREHASWYANLDEQIMWLDVAEATLKCVPPGSAIAHKIQRAIACTFNGYGYDERS